MTSRHTASGVTETRVVHDVHRRATSLLADVIGHPAPAVTELRNFVVAMLEHHHTLEDTDLWPLLVARAPRLHGELDRLTEEHDVLQQGLDELRAMPLGDDAAASPALSASSIRDLVHEHLAHEEPVLLPALEQTLPEAAWDEFSLRAVASAPQEGLPFLIAMVYEVGSPSEAEIVFRHVPPEARATIPGRRAEGERALADLRSGVRSAGGVS